MTNLTVYPSNINIKLHFLYIRKENFLFIYIILRNKQNLHLVAVIHDLLYLQRVYIGFHDFPIKIWKIINKIFNFVKIFTYR